jgi:hypothetical protein
MLLTKKKTSSDGHTLQYEPVQMRREPLEHAGHRRASEVELNSNHAEMADIAYCGMFTTSHGYLSTKTLAAPPLNVAQLPESSRSPGQPEWL